MGAARIALVALMVLMATALGGCTVIAVTGAVVGTGIAVGSAAVKGGVMVGKGAVAVASYPFRDSAEEKAAKEAKDARLQQELNTEQDR